MDRAEAAGFGVATAGHVALFALLSLSLAVTRLPSPPSAPIEVSFVQDVGPVNSAPQPSPAPPAPSAAPEAGPPEQAAPEPLPLTPLPPTPASAPPRAVEPPKPAPQPAQKPAPAKPAPPQAAAKPSPAPPAAKPAPAKAAPQTQGRSGTAQATHGSRLSLDFLKGIGSDPAPSQAQQAPASVMSAEALAGITAAIARQIQPCANRQVNPGPGANTIRVTLNLRLNRDGSLARTPQVVGITGVSGENARYEDRVKDLAVAAYVGCSPLRGLPDELYQTPKGGWANINMKYKLP
jgi:outer membrane biosynthesis protein TonB